LSRISTTDILTIEGDLRVWIQDFRIRKVIHRETRNEIIEEIEKIVVRFDIAMAVVFHLIVSVG